MYSKSLILVVSVAISVFSVEVFATTTHCNVEEKSKHRFAASFGSPEADEDGQSFGVHFLHEVVPSESGDVSRVMEVTGVWPGKDPVILLRYHRAAHSNSHTFHVLGEDIAYNDVELGNLDDSSDDLDDESTTVKDARTLKEDEKMRQFLNSKEALLLPHMSRELGKVHGASAREHPLTMPLHTLASQVAKERGISTKDLQVADRSRAVVASKSNGNSAVNLLWNRLKNCMKDANLCSSPSSCPSKCNTDKHDCGQRELTTKECKSGCNGMCGPHGCDCCWDWICGDCCFHRGCFNMRALCQNIGYALFSCWTAKGIMWGKDIDSFKACGGAIVPPEEMMPTTPPSQAPTSAPTAAPRPPQQNDITPWRHNFGCEPSFVLKNGVCERVVQPDACPPGFVFQNYKCVSLRQNEDITSVCPNGWKAEKGSCVKTKIEISCPEYCTAVDGRCSCTECPAPLQFNKVF